MKKYIIVAVFILISAVVIDASTLTNKADFRAAFIVKYQDGSDEKFSLSGLFPMETPDSKRIEKPIKEVTAIVSRLKQESNPYSHMVREDVPVTSSDSGDGNYVLTGNNGNYTLGKE
jgi:hypothetical protein